MGRYKKKHPDKRLGRPPGEAEVSSPLPQVVKMNHRELMRLTFSDAGFPYRLEFMTLPEDLQDEAVEMMDSGKTFAYIADYLGQKGHSIHPQALSRYYNLLRATRNDIERGAFLSMIQARYGELDPMTALQSAINLAHVQCLRLLAEDKVPASLLPRLLDSLMKGLKQLQKGKELERQVDRNVSVAALTCSEEKKREIKRIAYGIIE